MKFLLEFVSVFVAVWATTVAFDCKSLQTNMGATFDLTDLSRYINYIQ